MSEKVKLHTRYKNKEGKVIPGSTTVIGSSLGWNKNVLIAWARKEAAAGNDPEKIKAKAADIGTLAHYMILCHLKNEKPDLSDYSASDIDKAENCLLSYWAWEKENPITPIIIETPLISERYQYGGTIDCFAEHHGENMLIDYKTSSGIYPEMIIQVASYYMLLLENNYKVNQVRILKIGKEENEDFEVKTISEDKLINAFKVFEHCLGIYNLKKLI